MVGIFYEAIGVGEIRQAQDEVAFAYDPAWLGQPDAFPVSLTMPLRAEPYGPAAILPWLANLLPETHLTEIGQRIGVSPQDIIGLLARIGRDTAGALAIGRPRLNGEAFRVIGSAADLERVIDELPQKPFLIGEEGVSMSLAGAQEKLGVGLVDGRVAIPLDGTASTHILKPDIKRLKGSVQNEAFCLTLAGLIGLEASKVVTGAAGKRAYLLVERYDRRMTEKGVQRIHQEDLAQVLGILPKDKYEFDGLGRRSGPGLKALFGAVAEHVSPGARLTLLDGLIFNLICCNSDAHAKNYAILIGAAGTTRLAPLYDVLCGEVWPNITRALPQQLGARRRGADVQGSDWRMLAQEVGLSPARTLERVAELCEKAVQSIEAARDLVTAMPAGGNRTLDRVGFEVGKRAKRLRRQLAAG